MLAALNRQGKVVHLLDTSTVEKGEYRCPGCMGAVRLRRGQVLRPHFAHVSLEECHYFSENESGQHLQLKLSLYRWFQKTEKVSVEERLDEVEQIADLLVNDRIAIEVQCSRLSLERLQARTRSYQEKGYAVLWLLGKDLWLKERLSPLQRQFLYFSQNCGFYLWELDLECSQLRLRYLIHEDAHGQVQCLTRVFYLGEGRALDILRSPYGRQEQASLVGNLDPHLPHYVAKQLHYQVSRWMDKQAERYLQGDNLLSWKLDDFYPQVHPPESGIGFAQISADLTDYYQQFDRYYRIVRDKRRQVLYPPIFYKKWQEEGHDF